MNAEFDRILVGCLNTAKKIIGANTGIIKKLIPVLVDKRSIFRGECEKILKELGGINKVTTPLID